MPGTTRTGRSVVHRPRVVLGEVAHEVRVVLDLRELAFPATVGRVDVGPHHPAAPADVGDPAADIVVEEVAAELSRDLTEGQWTGKTITLKYKLDTFQGGSIVFAFRDFVDVLLRSVHSREVAGQVVIGKNRGVVQCA